jgi:hypothetical protein
MSFVTREAAAAGVWRNLKSDDLMDVAKDAVN